MTFTPPMHLLALLENMPQGFAVVDRHRRLAGWNQRLVDLLELPEGLLEVGVPIETLMQRAADGGFLGTGNAEQLAADYIARIGDLGENEVRAPNGRILDRRRAAVPDGGWVTTYTDITALKDVEAKVENQSALLRSILENTPQGLSVFGSDRRLVMCNEPFKDIFRYEEGFFDPGLLVDTLVARSVVDGYLGDGDPTELTTNYLTRLYEPKEREIHAPDGRVFDHRRKKMPDGGWVTAYTDITAIKRAQRALTFEKNRAEVTLRSIGDAVITTDANGNVAFMNPTAETLTGWSQPGALGLPIERVFSIFSEGDREPVVSPVARCIADGHVVVMNSPTILVARNGTEYFVQDSAAPIWADDGSLDGVVLVFSDTTERNRLARKARYEAAHDSLTGLVNRREFETQLQHALESAHEDRVALALVYFDLDQFKVVNDTKGRH